MKKSESAELTTSRRLHPVSVIFFIGKSVKDLLYPMIAFILTTVFRDDINWLWLFGGIAVMMIIMLTIGLLTWYRFVYYLDQGSLRVDHGIFIRKKLWITKDRVQAVDTTAGVLHRIFGLLKLQVETAGGKKPEVVLNAISGREAEQIRIALGLMEVSQPEIISDVPQATPVEKAAPVEQRIRLSFSDLLIYSTTSGKIGVVLAVIGAAYSQLDEWLAETLDIWGFISYWMGSAQIVWLIVFLIVIAWLLAVLFTSIREYGFTLQLKGDKLVIERGLLERKQVTVPLQRIQAVHLVENVFRRPFGLVTVHIVSAGYAGKEGESAILFPLVRERELAAFLARFTPQYQLADEWSRLGKRSLLSFMLVPVILTLAISIPAIIWIPYSLGWFALLLPLLAVLWSWLRYRQTGWSLLQQQIAIQYGSFNRHRILVPKRRIQWNRLSQSVFQVRKELATLNIALTSGALPALFYIKHLPFNIGMELKTWMIGKKVNPPQQSK
ncbi:PH domain-containing protein [Paenibacillus abyssi]|uniref:UPF0699 transmembrane protein YdbT n=1 Tax=Paenibacillus abyssi TaxID=1340531 RepID=A0A917FLK1_9BACL|nr:PH domain-containing protein [Paenibacillus abyssi]GGF89945.1 UPF0699 transmembrane protein YdbT [Paenibacillus abyssi]